MYGGDVICDEFLVEKYWSPELVNEIRAPHD